MIAFDLLIPSHGWIFPIINLIESMPFQGVFPQRIVILIWKECTVIALQEFAERIHHIVDPLGCELIIQHAHYSDHVQWRGVAYDRQFLISQAQQPYLCMIDEDNVLPDNCLADWIAWYTQVVTALWREAVVSPIILREGKIQSQGITWFSYFFPRYTFWRCGNKPRQEVKMVWANSLFGRTDIFQRIQFDPYFVGSYEDIDFTSRVRWAWYALVVLRDVGIDHQESKKTFLGELFLGTPQHAFYRSRNRIVRVRKTATTWQKIQYFWMGLRIQTAWWIWYIARSWVKHKKSLYRAIGKWIVAWLFVKKAALYTN